jgi:DNA-binding MarR family transcriptional regulator
MTESIPPEVLRKVRKLAQLPDDAWQSRLAVSVTRLTVLKSLCQQPELADRFVTYLAHKVLERVEQGTGHASRPKKAADLVHREMMSAALAGMEAWQQGPTENLRRALGDLYQRMKGEQNEHRNIPYGAVRLIEDRDLFLCEQALACLLHPQESGNWAYKVARDYAEHYDPSHGTGLTPASAPLLQDIADFWMREVGVTDKELATLVRKGQPKEAGASARKAYKIAAESRKKARFTPRQGQFLAFIHLYRRLHRQGPAETDMVKFFRVTPPTAHGMVVKLEELGLVARESGVGRSIRVAIPEEEIPKLEETDGLPW